MKLLLQFTVLITLCTSNLFSQIEWEEDIDFRLKTVDTTFISDNIAAISLNDNKFGDINVTTDAYTDLILVKTTILVDTNDTIQAKNILKEIEIKFLKKNNILNINTLLGGGITDNHSYQITFDIIVPASIRLNLENNFGNITINKIQAPSDIYISYGELRIKEVRPTTNTTPCKIGGNFAEIFIDKITNAYLTTNHSKLNVTQADNIKLESKFSIIKINNISTLNYKTQSDKTQINNIKNLNTTGNHTTFNINTLQRVLNTKLNYGAFNIENISSNFNYLQMDNENIPVKLKVSPQANYNINAEVEEASIYYPKKYNVKQYKDNATTTIQGTIGNNPKTQANIIIFSKYADVTIK